ncbi:hypothetical protein L4D09_19705 [Photobacterium makurazakiensis]|uniref:hypothetical protein n=1 Tax=Photobacterium makurazakiensis TaxID=2910234 RepID=UPI003D129DE4
MGKSKPTQNKGKGKSGGGGKGFNPHKSGTSTRKVKPTKPNPTNKVRGNLSKPQKVKRHPSAVMNKRAEMGELKATSVQRRSGGKSGVRKG